MAVHDIDNVLNITESIDTFRQIDYFIRSCDRIINNRGHERVLVSLDVPGRTFPNTKVPIAAIITHYKKRGVTFEPMNNPEPLEVYRDLFEPRDASVASPQDERNVLAKTWYFDENTVATVADELALAAFQQTPFSTGSFDAFNWCLFEVMDNVIQHSQQDWGVVETQIHTRSARLSVSVADCGIGILKSFQGTSYKPANEVDAITLALKENITRDANVGQGNGLWGLYEIAHRHNGSLAIVSGRGSVRIIGDEAPHTQRNWALLSESAPGTFIDIQFDIAAPINIQNILGHKPVNLVIERQAHMDPYGTTVAVQDISNGFGTRNSGRQARNSILNMLKTIGTPITIDFKGVSIISSSFGDEFIGKLIMQLGVIEFTQSIHMINLNETVKSLIDKSVNQRMLSGHE